MKISQNAPPHYITLRLLRFLKDYIQQVNGDRFRRGDFTFWKNMGLFFTQTAFVTVGGSYTVLPYVAHYSVTKLHWLSKLQMIDGFALAETTPGPLIIVLSFVGFMAGYNHFGGSLWMGAAGLLATTYFTFLPCFLMIFAGAPLIEKTHGIEIIEGIPGLITAAVVGVILNLTLYLGKDLTFPGGVLFSHPDILAPVWISVSLVLMLKFRMNILYLIGLSVLYGLLHYLLYPLGYNLGNEVIFIP